MTAIADKLAEAGVKLPTANFRIWHFLHDHPGKTLDQLSKCHVIENYGSLSSVLCQAVYRGLLTVEHAYDRRTSKTVKCYYAAYSTFEEATLKAKPHKRHPKKVEPPQSTDLKTKVTETEADDQRTLDTVKPTALWTPIADFPQGATVYTVSSSSSSPEDRAKDYVKSATLQEAKALYDELSTFFKGSVA